MFCIISTTKYQMALTNKSSQIWSNLALPLMNEQLLQGCNQVLGKPAEVSKENYTPATGSTCCCTYRGGPASLAHSLGGGHAGLQVGHPTPPSVCLLWRAHGKYLWPSKEGPRETQMDQRQKDHLKKEAANPVCH